MNGKKALGDYQTPTNFANNFCSILNNRLSFSPSVIIEPTCGKGNILESSLSFHADKYYGIEINSKYCEYCKERFFNQRVEIVNKDIFDFNIKEIIGNKSDILVIGNPPWVTNSTLSILESDNVPIKSNIKDLHGMDAITGLSNFDICEYIILKLIEELNNSNAVIAMLCKTSVARNVFKELKRKKINFNYCDILEFNASKVFHISVNACAVIIQLSREVISPNICSVYDFDNPAKIKYTFGYVDGKFYSNIRNNAYDFDGDCCFEWRQGVKHDCSKIMELTKENHILINGNKQIVDIEDTNIFPLVKSSMFKKVIIRDFSKYVLVTQRKVKEDTRYLQFVAPKTWEYLNGNIEVFNKRKSAIYRNAPLFSMFGIGDYSFSKYKVGISGFYKKPIFSVLYSNDEKPVMTDDTSYFIGFDNYDMAYIAMLFLNSEIVQDFLISIACLDSKRPYTKQVLKRLDFKKIVKTITLKSLQDTERQLGLPSYVNFDIYEIFKEYIFFYQPEQITLPL